MACGRGVLEGREGALGPLRGLAVHRAGLFNVLHDAAKAAGIEIRTGCKIKGLEKHSLILNQGGRVGTFDLVIDALGSRSPLIEFASGPDNRRRLDYGAIWASLPWPKTSFDANALEQRDDLASIMCGVLPMGKRDEDDRPQADFSGSWETPADPPGQAVGPEAGREAGVGGGLERLGLFAGQSE